MDDFYCKKLCDRCGKPLIPYRIMSRFNTDCLCSKCAEEERRHPDYHTACEAERQAVKAGDYNFQGIGWPGKNGRINNN